MRTRQSWTVKSCWRKGFSCNLKMIHHLQGVYYRKSKLRWLKIEQRLVDLDIAVKTSLHLERPAPDECISALDELNELALAPLMLKKQPDIVTTIRFENALIRQRFLCQLLKHCYYVSFNITQLIQMTTLLS